MSQQIQWGPFVIVDMWKLCRDITRVDMSGATDPAKVIPKARALAGWFYLWSIGVPVVAFVRSLFIAAGPDLSIGVRVFMVLIGYLIAMTLLPIVGLVVAGKTWPILGRWLGVKVDEHR